MIPTQLQQYGKHRRDPSGINRVGGQALYRLGGNLTGRIIVASMVGGVEAGNRESKQAVARGT